MTEKEMITLSMGIRITDNLYQEAKERARAEFRSTPEQVEYWATLGKIAFDNPDLPIEFIRDTLVAKREHANSKGRKSEKFEFRNPIQSDQERSK